eukprot:TRINITY_DN26120_c0_g1_i1.p1 TRINITY_DN26120_c0_g1~~TRINITY_DN26120_c0_g1_i1.p1  ORF type:complete len:551 (+),score=108.40 TRINITY_DN26120_c0_g1_i1:341-1993(+)
MFRFERVRCASARGSRSPGAQPTPCADEGSGGRSKLGAALNPWPGAQRSPRADEGSGGRSKLGAALKPWRPGRPSAREACATSSAWVEPSTPSAGECGASGLSRCFSPSFPASTSSGSAASEAPGDDSRRCFPEHFAEHAKADFAPQLAAFGNYDGDPNLRTAMVLLPDDLPKSSQSEGDINLRTAMHLFPDDSQVPDGFERASLARIAGVASPSHPVRSGKLLPCHRLQPSSASSSSCCARIDLFHDGRSRNTDDGLLSPQHHTRARVPESPLGTQVACSTCADRDSLLAQLALQELQEACLENDRAEMSARLQAAESEGALLEDELACAERERLAESREVSLCRALCRESEVRVRAAEELCTAEVAEAQNEFAVFRGESFLEAEAATEAIGRLEAQHEVHVAELLAKLRGAACAAEEAGADLVALRIRNKQLERRIRRDEREFERSQLLQAEVAELRCSRDAAVVAESAELAAARCWASDAMAEAASAGEARRAAEDAQLCCVCQEAHRDTLLLPCAHLALCDACGAMLRQCPICRTPARQRLRVIFS